MALDVYVGTMTRFYRREWENVAQRMAREQGIQYTIIHAGGPPEAPPSANEVRGAVAAWCSSLSAGLAAHGCAPLEWNEDDTQPYFTDRPAWVGYTALLVWAAHTEHADLPMPIEVPESWADDAAYQRSQQPEFRSRFRTILEPQLWLPVEFPFVFEAPTIHSEDPARIGSTFTLKQQLDDLLALSDNGLRTDRPSSSPNRDSAERSFIGRLLGHRPIQPQSQQSDLAAAAGAALRIFRTLAEDACEHRLPILLDF
jgi:hypothetical protein